MKGDDAKPGGLCPYGQYTLDATGAYTFAAVFFTASIDGDWGYKDMDEGMGPVQSEAPLALLSLLSPTSKEYALDWRDRCRKTAALKSRKVTDGDVIRLAQPMTFTDGIERSLFKVEISKNPWAKRAKTRFQCVETNVHCRINGFTKMAWEKVDPATALDSATMEAAS